MFVPTLLIKTRKEVSSLISCELGRKGSREEGGGGGGGGEVGEWRFLEEEEKDG